MASRTTTIGIVVVVVVVIVVVAAALVLSRGDDDDDSSDSTTTNSENLYTFTDANNITHTVEVPLHNVSVVHKYIPVFMKILGLEDEVYGMDNTYGIRFMDMFPNSFLIGDNFTPDGATMLANGSNVILTPVNMGLSNADALRQMGIEVIYIDLTDPYVIEDNLWLMVKLFGDTEELNERANEYLALFNECYDFVGAYDFSATADANVCLYMSSSGFYHTHTSAAAKVIESVSGYYYSRIIDPNCDPANTVYFTQSAETIYAFDGEYGLDFLFLYGLDSHDDNLKVFLDSGGDIDYTQMSVFQNKHVYSLNVDCVNGALCCVSLLLYAEAFSGDSAFGDKATEMVQTFNDTFGLNFSTVDLLVQMA